MNDLAWALAKAARPHLSKGEASRIFIEIGAGDTYAAIDTLISAMARKHIPLRPELADAVAAWLDGYRGQDAERQLRERLAEVVRHSPPRVSPFEELFGRARVSAEDPRSTQKR